MSDCKAIISVDICGNESLDAVVKLVAQGMSVSKACNKVADEFNAANQHASVKAASLRRSYYRDIDASQKPAAKKKTKKEDVPSMDMNLYVPVEKFKEVESENEALKAKVKELQDICNEFVLGQASSNSSTTSDAVHGSTNGNGECIIKREVAFAFIADKGNDNQRNAITKTNLTNAQMFNLLNGVKTRYLEKFPPTSIPAEILNATGIES